MTAEYGKVWDWQHVERREDYPSIVNQRGTTIFIAPRRYVIQLNLKPQNEPLRKGQLEEVKSIASRVHSYQYAPEPLKSLVSIFQLLGAKSGKVIYVYLTNISSQKIRRDLLNGILGVLETNYAPLATWIQQGTTKDIPTCYETSTKEAAITAVTTAQRDIDLHQRELQPPWKREMVFKVTEHIATGRDQAAMPNRDQAGPSREAPRKRGVFITNEQKKKRAHDQAVEEALNEDDEILMQAAMELIEEDLGTIPSSSTKRIKKKDGGQQHGEKPSHNLPASTTETTTTSYSETGANQTSADNATESEDSFVLRAQELQRSLSHALQLDFYGTLFSIVSVTASRASISMVLESKKK